MDAIITKDPGNPHLTRRGERAEWLLGLGSALNEQGDTNEACRVWRECIETLDRAVNDGLPRELKAEVRRSAESALADSGSR